MVLSTTVDKISTCERLGQKLSHTREYHRFYFGKGDRIWQIHAEYDIQITVAVLFFKIFKNGKNRIQQLFANYKTGVNNEKICPHYKSKKQLKTAANVSEMVQAPFASIYFKRGNRDLVYVILCSAGRFPLTN